ncbi:intercellular adhesion molecule 3 isoform X3 [Saimiri boliviensis]|uniref:intercellular adhesion molecule 3 isoform X3 n=1 Tax=Saimiri boliviensis TaxID=27679 RepID=UPI00193E7535|nr:intercellular adhesion molecule 3 isoform X2 [Saimiri boliviensis boliviensis]
MATMIPAVSWLRACWTLLVCCLLTPGVQGQEFLLRVEPQNPVLPAGGSLLVNCSTDCPSAKQVTLETSLSKELVDNGTGWAAFWISKVTGDNRILCSGYCNGSQIIGSTGITVYTLPVTPPRLVAPRFLEVETSWPVDCTLDGLFPASEAQVHLALGDQVLNATVTNHGDMITATATATARADQEGARQMICNVTLGGERLEARENLTVFSFLGPILNLSEPSAPEGSTVIVSCMAGARVQVTLDGVPAAAPGQPAQLQLNTTENDNGRSFFCSATLEVDGEFLHRNSSVQLRVLYGPQIDRAKCPQHLKWKDKTTQVLQCQARGNPLPQLQCLKEGSSQEVPVGIPFLVNVTHNGTYQCQAVSSRGKYTLVLVINIEAGNSHFVPVLLAVFTTLGVVTVVVALTYDFWARKRRGLYHVRQESPSLPLTSMPTEAMNEEPSRVE